MDDYTEDEWDEDTVTATELVADEGTIVVFRGRVGDGAVVTFACDWRLAQDIVGALQGGEEPECSVPSWAVLRSEDPDAEYERRADK